MKKPTTNPELDLVLERIVDVPADLVWKAWTEAEHLKEWFCPKPWQVTDCRLDLQPGGEFFTVMRGPEGQEFPNAGCYLEIVPGRKLVWTSALGPGFRPVAKPTNGPDLLFTAHLFIEPEGQGTRYTAIAQHADPTSAKAHAEMGFQEGWGKCLDQLVEMVKGW